jgi:hypothetical protein
MQDRPGDGYTYIERKKCVVLPRQRGVHVAGSIRDPQQAAIAIASERRSVPQHRRNLTGSLSLT